MVSERSDDRTAFIYSEHQCIASSRFTSPTVRLHLAGVLMAVAFLVSIADAKAATGCAATEAHDMKALGIDTTKDDFKESYECFEDTDICKLKDGKAPINTGDTAWMIAATTFVMLQTPATGFAQAGLVRRKNAMSLIGQSIIGVVIGSVLWYLFGYSMTFGASLDGFIGDPGAHAAMKGVSAFDCIDGQTIPALLWAAFQMTFALMVPVLITGAWAEKFYFSAACLFMVIWPILVCT